MPQVKEYSVSEWSALSPAQIAAPLPWSETSLCVHHAGYKGTRGGVLMIRLGDGADAQSLCVKPCQRLVNMDLELLAADILSAAGLRVPAARLATQAEIEDEMVPNLIAKFECTSGSWNIPDFLASAGLYCMRADLRKQAGIPDSVAVAQLAALKASRAERRAAIEAGEARAEPVAVLEFVRGPTLPQAGGIAALGEGEYETLGLLAALDVLLNNADRLPIFFETEGNQGNLGNIILEPSADGSVVCCAIDSCVNPLEGAALEKYVERIRAQGSTPSLTAASAALEMLGGTVLLDSHLSALRYGWYQGLEKICEMTQNGALRAAIDTRVDAAVAAGGTRGELPKATTHLLTVAEAIASLVAAGGVPPPRHPPEAYPENRLSGSSALGAFLMKACASLPPDATALFAFDFDKTLTNGFAPPGASLEARIRGGAHTLEGLKATADLPGARRYIITARADETGRVSQGTLQQLASQISRSQPELLEYFDAPSDESCHRIVKLSSTLVPDTALSEAVSGGTSHGTSLGTSSSPGASPPHAWWWRDVPLSRGGGMYATLQGDGGPILHGGSVLASGYNKCLALLFACTAQSDARPPTHIFFVDDNPHNAYEVHCDLPERMRVWAGAEACHSGPQVTGWAPVVRSLWWDLHEEEFESQTIPPNTSGPDFAYLRDGAHRDFLYGPALRHFGLSPSDIAERAQRYERVRKEREELRAASRSNAEPAS